MIKRYYAIRVDFQTRRSPHVHLFIWILNAPALNKSKIEEYIMCFDSIICSELPNLSKEAELHEVVKTLQKHRHTRKCIKLQIKKLRYSTLINVSQRELLLNNLSQISVSKTKKELMQSKKETLSKVRNYIGIELNPSKKNLCHLNG